MNSFIAGIAVLLGYIIAAGTLTPKALLLIPVVVAITAAGNVVNDYYDRDIDRINRPDRPIPSGQISPRSAYLYSLFLFALGLGITAFFYNIILFALSLFNSFLLVLYAKKLKGIALIGNFSVAYLSASIFLFGGAILGIQGLLQNFSIAVIVFLAMLSREMLKDAEDIVGDTQGGAHTLPMIIGIHKTCLIALIFAVCAVLMSYIPLMKWWGPLYIIFITPAGIVILLGAFRAYRCSTPACVRSSQATLILKTGMFIALAVFILAALLF